jgi:hypothetical protein
MNFGFLSKRGYYEREEVKKQPKLMKEMGVNLTTLNLNICQDTYASTKLYLDFEYSVGEDELVEMANLLHEQGIMVLFKPCMTCLDGQPMCNVRFPEMGLQIEGVRVDYRKAWFDSYTKCLVYCARLAQKMKAEGLMLGAELFGVEGGVGVEEYWRNLIAEVRKVYDGALTYEFTCVSRKSWALKWFDELDFLSYSYYPPACPRDHMDDPQNNPSYTKEQMKEYLSDRKEKTQTKVRRQSAVRMAAQAADACRHFHRNGCNVGTGAGGCRGDRSWSAGGHHGNRYRQRCLLLREHASDAFQRVTGISLRRRQGG